MIEIQNLYKYYAERRAVGPLSFSIETGEVVGLLGLNGAGKTTTLRILACDLLPSSGSVKVDGIDVVDSPGEVRKRIGYLPDTPPLYNEMTVGDYLVFVGQLRGMSQSAAKKRLPEVAAATQLEDVVSDPISSLSHGFRQRVGIAQAIVHKPRLLVLDEPISGLDPKQIVEMRELVRGLRGDHTIVISSHILPEISETCDRILVIDDGELRDSGTPAELSARLLSASRVEVTVTGDAEKAEKIATSLEGVEAVTVIAAPKEGEDAKTLRIEGSRDVRSELCKALIAAGIEVVDLRRSERELESVFLSLAGHRSSEAEEDKGTP